MLDPALALALVLALLALLRVAVSDRAVSVLLDRHDLLVLSALRMRKRVSALLLVGLALCLALPWSACAHPRRRASDERQARRCPPESTLNGCPVISRNRNTQSTRSVSA